MLLPMLCWLGQALTLQWVLLFQELTCDDEVTEQGTGSRPSLTLPSHSEDWALKTAHFSLEGENRKGAQNRADRVWSNLKQS